MDVGALGHKSKREDETRNGRGIKGKSRDKMETVTVAPGVRPSPGAAICLHLLAPEEFKPPRSLVIAAPEDGRSLLTPIPSPVATLRLYYKKCGGRGGYISATCGRCAGGDHAVVGKFLVRAVMSCPGRWKVVMPLALLFRLGVGVQHGDSPFGLHHAAHEPRAFAQQFARDLFHADLQRQLHRGQQTDQANEIVRPCPQTWPRRYGNSMVFCATKLGLRMNCASRRWAGSSFSCRSFLT